MDKPAGEIQSKIEQLMIQYYTDYYREQLGLPDYQTRVKNRLAEDESRLKNISWMENLLNYKFDSTKRTLVVGGGTGAEFIALSRKGAKTYTLEPNEKAVQIIKLKATQAGILLDRIKQGYAERIPFQDNFFDFVYCHTVLEHVANAKVVIHEMVRVTKHGGYAYIICPDYRHIYEPHYKIYLPLFLPRSMIKVFLWLIGRPLNFLSNLQFVNANQLRNIFRNCNVISMQICFPYTAVWENPEGWNRATKFIQDRLGISRDQYWLIKKQ